MRKPRPVKVKIVRYCRPDGTRCKKGEPGAVRSVEESETYYANVEGERVSLKTADLSQAWANLRAELRRRELRRQGITDDMSEHAGRPVEGHRDAWLAAVADGGTGAGQLALLRSHLTTLCRLAGWKRLADLTPETCGRALARLQKDGRSARTRNHYLRHAKQFTRWLVDNDRLARDPLRSLRAIDVEADRRRFHRCPADAEMALLFDYLESPAARTNKGTSGRGPRQRLADGRQRALAYKVSMATGYRANEVRNLTREGIDLDAACATCRAGYSKRRRRDTQPLPPWLVGELRAWFDGGGAWERLPSKGGEMLQADLAAAGVEYRTAAGEFTFHSLRVWYITRLANDPDVSPKRLFELARHSDPRLTLATYAKVQDRQELHADVERAIPRPGTGKAASNPPPGAAPGPGETG